MLVHSYILVITTERRPLHQNIPRGCGVSSTHSLHGTKVSVYHKRIHSLIKSDSQMRGSESELEVSASRLST